MFGVHEEWSCEERTEVAVLLSTVPNNRMTKIVKKMKTYSHKFSMSLHLHILLLSYY